MGWVRIILSMMEGSLVGRNWTLKSALCGSKTFESSESLVDWSKIRLLFVLGFGIGTIWATEDIGWSFEEKELLDVEDGDAENIVLIDNDRTAPYMCRHDILSTCSPSICSARFRKLWFINGRHCAKANKRVTHRLYSPHWWCLPLPHQLRHPDRSTWNEESYELKRSGVAIERPR